MLRLLTLLLLMLISWPLQGQGRHKIPEDQVLKNFFSFGGHLNTRGWDAGIQYERVRTKGRHLAVLQLSYMRDRGEIRRESLFKSQNGTNFVMNKVNYFMMLHTGVGRSFTLFDRDKFSRARLSAGFIAGPSLGLIIPYRIYRFVPYQGSTQLGYREEASFYDGVTYEDVIGELGLMRGSRNMRYCPGATAEFRLQMDLGEKADFIRAISLHLRADYFYRGVTIVLPKPQYLFLTGGIGFMLGNAW